MYLVTGTEDGDLIFEILDDGSKGEVLGEYQDGEPVFIEGLCCNGLE
jgi:hypothetical protein